MIKCNCKMGAGVLACLTIGLMSPSYGAVYLTPTGATVPSDGAVSASASVTLGNGTVTVVLSDLLKNPTSSGETLSGLFFTISGAGSPVTLSSALGVTAVIDKNGNYTPSASPQNIAPHWGVENGVNLSTIGITKFQPFDLIVGPDNLGKLDGSGKYSNANGGFDNFNPYVIGSATFVVNIPGITSQSTISGVQFEFGTIPQYVSAVPEPTTMIAGALLLLPFGASTLRVLRKKRVV
jgi:hypothetical protein